jgi:hypothetical protein
MKVIRTLAVLGLSALGAALVGAQPASAPGPGTNASSPGPGTRASGPGPGPRGASAPGMGTRMGQGMGPGAQAGPRGAGRWGTDYTPGWGMMSPKERDDHRARIGAAKTYDECKTLQQQHRDAMAARAKERGVNAPLPQPRRDACAGLKP